MNITKNEDSIKIETEGGYLVASIKSEDAMEFELEGLSEEKINEFYKITKYHDIVLIESIHVDSEYRSQGLASKLIEKLDSYVTENDYRFMYLNACPILNENGLDLSQLESFYSKKGFRIFLNQGKNTLMVRDMNS